MTVVATTTATRDEAERLTERIRLTATNYVEARDKLAALLDEAQQRQVHAALGFASWTAYLAATFADQPMILPTAERREVVGMLAAEGMSTRAIAPIVGVTQRQVARDAEQVRHDVSPAARSVDTSTGEITEMEPTPRVVTGLDGKTYTTKPALPAAPKRRPLTDAFLDATYELTKAVERLERLVADDRFAQNAEKAAQRNRGDLLRARDSLAGVIAALNSTIGA
jgi:hypothetical protein